MQKLTTDLLKECYQYALDQQTGFLDELSTLGFSGHYPENPNWAIGPFEKANHLTFHLDKQWPDPTGIGWRSGFLFNPSTIEKDGLLYLFYRASPKKESLSSRIGVACYNPQTGWQDYMDNPIVYPETDNEVFSCEDPKVYRAEGKYFLFYNGVWPVQGTAELSLYNSTDYPMDLVGTDIKLAVSEDLFHWQKLGNIMDYSVSHLWAKGAVIPRNPQGEAVKINGEYLMFISEGCGGQQHVGHSQDMLHWEFKPQPFLDASSFGQLFEVACAVAGHDTQHQLVLDFFYRDKQGHFAAAQALYDLANPYKQLALSRGGTLAWGGLMQYQDKWLFAQGWDAMDGALDMYFYTAGIKPHALVR